MLHPLQQYELYEVASATLYLSSKLEESQRRLRNFVIVVAQKAAKNDNLVVDEGYKEFWRWRGSVVYYEERVLEALCFDVGVEHPYEKALEWSMRAKQEVKDTSFALINDSYRLTTVCLQFTTPQIAAACVILAHRLLNEPLPIPTQPPTPTRKTPRKPQHVRQAFANEEGCEDERELKSVCEAWGVDAGKVEGVMWEIVKG
ncbi:hypothetical protein HDV05_002125, partial [Chytridiales sp. JEL 0842]